MLRRRLSLQKPLLRIWVRLPPTSPNSSTEDMLVWAKLCFPSLRHWKVCQNFLKDNWKSFSVASLKSSHTQVFASGAAEAAASLDSWYLSCSCFDVLTTVLCVCVYFPCMQDMSQLEFLYLSNNKLDYVPTPLPLSLRVLHLQVQAHAWHASSLSLKWNVAFSQVTR